MQQNTRKAGLGVHIITNQMQSTQTIYIQGSINNSYSVQSGQHCY